MGSAPGANREELEKNQRAWPTGLSVTPLQGLAPPLTGSRHAHPAEPIPGVSTEAQSPARAVVVCGEAWQPPGRP